MRAPIGVTRHNEGAQAASGPTLSAVLSELTRRLVQAGVETPRVDALLLTGHVLGASRGAVEAKALAGGRLTPGEASRVEALAARRARREPLQHVVGVAAFRTLSLEVGPGVFVPRPETETVAEWAIDALRACGPGALAVDLGTGSGALALSMAVEVPGSRVVAVERSRTAWSWARRNVDRVAPGVRLVHAAIETALPELDGEVDVVVSNPPYVPVRAIPAEAEARRDPAQALFGGADGFDVVRALAFRAARLVRPGGMIVVEHGEEQGRAVRGILACLGWGEGATHPDLTGRDRCTSARRL